MTAISDAIKKAGGPSKAAAQFHVHCKQARDAGLSVEGALAVFRLVFGETADHVPIGNQYQDVAPPPTGAGQRRDETHSRIASTEASGGKDHHSLTPSSTVSSPSANLLR